MSENTTSASASDSSVIYEGLRVQKKRASLMQRSIACLLDIGLMTMIMYFFFIIAAMLFALLVAGIGQFSDKVAGILAIIGGVAAIIGGLLFHSFYFIWYEKKKGMTPGKRAMAIRVVSDNGKPLTFTQCLIREILRMIDIYMIFPGIISILITKDNKRLGDLLADTTVIYSKSVEQKSTFTYISQEAYLYLYEQLAPAAIGNDQALIFNNFALQHLILNKPSHKIPSAQTAMKLLAEHEFNGDSESQQKVQGIDRIRFFAEFCNQSTLAQQKKASS